MQLYLVDHVFEIISFYTVGKTGTSTFSDE